MNCYNFEENISAFIESDISLKLRNEFIKHRDICPECSRKLEGVAKIMTSIKQFEPVATSADFLKNLHQRLEKYDSRKEPLLKRLLNYQPFGLKPVAALGFVSAFVLLTISSFLLFQNDSVPQLNVTDFSQKPAQMGNQSPFMANSKHAQTAVDSLSKEDTLRDPAKRFDDQILMVNQKSNQ